MEMVCRHSERRLFAQVDFPELCQGNGDGVLFLQLWGSGSRLVPLRVWRCNWKYVLANPKGKAGVGVNGLRACRPILNAAISTPSLGCLTRLDKPFDPF